MAPLSATFIALLGLSLTAGAATSAGTPPPRERMLLERHRPILRYDRRERSFATGVEAMTGRYVVGAASPGNRLVGGDGRVIATANPRLSPPRLSPGLLGATYAVPGSPRSTRDDRIVTLGRPLERGRRGRSRDLAYGRVASGRDGRRWLQYWLFFEDNAQDRGIVRTGRHAGDWEFAQLRLDARGRPDRLTAAQHAWAEGCGWDQVEHVGPAPVLFVAHASHATYLEPGVKDRPLPDPNDEADGQGRRVRPTVQPIDARSPRWVRWPGRWGESQAGPVPGEQSSPRGPAFQDDERWRDPSAYDAGARACGSGPPRRPWQTAVLLGALAAVGLLAVSRRRARPGG